MRDLIKNKENVHFVLLSSCAAQYERVFRYIFHLLLLLLQIISYHITQMSDHGVNLSNGSIGIEYILEIHYLIKLSLSIKTKDRARKSQFKQKQYFILTKNLICTIIYKLILYHITYIIIINYNIMYYQLLIKSYFLGQFRGGKQGAKIGG